MVMLQQDSRSTLKFLEAAMLVLGNQVERFKAVFDVENLTLRTKNRTGSAV